MPRASLVSYENSPFCHLYNSGVDQALINATGLDHETFKELLAIFTPVYDTHTPHEESGFILPKVLTGKPRQLPASGALGLVMCGTGPLELCPEFFP